MVSRQILLAMLFPAAAAADEERRTTTIPEPRRTPEKPPRVVVALDYPLAREGTDRLAAAVPELLAFLKTRTGIREPVSWREESMTDPQFAGALLVYLTGNAADLTASGTTKTRLGQYLKEGGLLFAEDVRPSNLPVWRRRGAGLEGTPFDRQFKHLMKDPQVLGGAGADWEPIPKTHPLYDCYFRFSDGPPLSAAPFGTVTQLEMLQIRGRVGVIFSDLSITWAWGDPAAGYHTLAMQFGANLLVFAMTRQAAGERLR